MNTLALPGSLHVPLRRMTQILAGKRGITADTALRLSRCFGTTPEFWLHLQLAYELRLAEPEHGDEILRTIAPLAVAAE